MPEYVRPWMYAKQLDALFCPERYGVTEATVKSGKTVGALAWLFEQAILGQAGRHYWWIAPVYGQAEIAYRRLKRGLPQGFGHLTDGKLIAELPNGAIMDFRSAEKPDNLYGEDVWAAVIDEGTRVREEAWHAVRSTLTATQGPIRVIGNVKGRKNWMYELARKAQSGEPDMHYGKITAYDAVEAGILALAEIENAKSLLPEQVFRELYLAEPSDDGGNPFGLAAIRACIGPLSTAEPKAWGWDLAKSQDWTVGVGLDASGYVCRLERWQGPWEDTLRKIRYLTQAPALVDSTGVGDPIVEALQREAPGLFEGFKFSQSSKQQLMEGLAVAIQQGGVRIPDGVLVSELESYEYVYSRTGVSYSAPAGQHDDTVCALALAVQKLGRVQRDVTLRFFDTAIDGEFEERLVDAAATVSEAVASGGIYWPGGR